ncbi:MAG: dioxygenase [Zhongshania sp.]|jgi:aromatic ring-opening dioxygenase catalytic subunit (LigB family)|nr:dioxygenase [Zhongshania sp.]
MTDQVNAQENLAPVLFIPHGGGPLPLLGDPGHRQLTTFLKSIASELGAPTAIVIVSAHWEGSQATLTGAANPELIYDYYGFPEESYALQYSAVGSPALAETVRELLADAGIPAHIDPVRGYDHGMFVPLTLMYPAADIPCVQLSLLSSLDPAAHIAMGRALSKLREQNILVIGSGLSFHNLRAFSHADAAVRAEEFDDWLVETCAGVALGASEREQRLINWATAPQARFSHPREEHLLPLHVCFGVAAQHSSVAELVFNDDMMGIRVSGLLWR